MIFSEDHISLESKVVAENVYSDYLGKCLLDITYNIKSLWSHIINSMKATSIAMAKITFFSLVMGTI